MNNIFVSQVTTLQNLHTLEFVASDWLEQAKIRQQYAIKLNSDKQHIFFDAQLVLECILAKQPQTHCHEYRFMRNTERNIWEFYVAFDRYKHIQGIGVIHKITGTRELKLAYLVTNPNNIDLVSTAGKIKGIGRALLSYAVKEASHAFPEQPFIVTSCPSAVKFYEACGFEKCESNENDLAPDTDQEFLLQDSGKKLLFEKCAAACKKVSEPQLEKQACLPLSPYLEEVAEVIGKVKKEFDHFIHNCIAEYIGVLKSESELVIEAALKQLSLN